MLQTGHIHVLSDAVANKIAAGEVVERPASVLKELIENALDAGATQIDVEIVGGGLKSIVVSDNGSGMSRDDALLSVERHATSKIRDVEDIERVETLGFRGEALAAISSVARFTLTTRTAGSESGIELTMNGGRMGEVREIGCPPGSTVAVRNLFFNVPARRKFLKSEQTESSHLRQVFILYALSHPAVGMRLVVEDREIYRLTGNASLDERIRELFGAELLPMLRSLEYASDAIALSGYVGLPGSSRGDRSDQYIFVNGRPASAPVVSFALGEAYHTLIPKGRYPVVFLFITIDAGQVDVNVHPTKKEVRFRQTAVVRDALIQAVRNALALPPSAPGGGAAPPVAELLSAARGQAALRIADMPSLAPFAYPRISPLPDPAAQPTSAEVPAAVTTGPAAKPSFEAPWSWCRILGQVGGLYVIMETEDGVIVMDPHAAHERINYERFMKEVVGNKVRSQGLLRAETVQLQPEQAMTVRKNLDALRHMGFGISDFGGDTFLVDSMPVCLGTVGASVVLAEIAQGLERGGQRGGTERWAEERIAQAACKASVKARDRLTVQEVEGLVTDLARCEMPYTCPHGRPTLIFMSYHELGRKFGRE